MSAPPPSYDRTQNRLLGCTGCLGVFFWSVVVVVIVGIVGSIVWSEVFHKGYDGTPRPCSETLVGSPNYNPNYNPDLLCDPSR